MLVFQPTGPEPAQSAGEADEGQNALIQIAPK
ncbi:hypothetical protein J2Z84_004708 [Agrobacterium rubi]|nr:hypothetical protein [Agrobacterium rubi]